MNEYMPAMHAVKTDKPASDSGTPQGLQLKRKSGLHGKAAFKQTTLMFGKKPKSTPTASAGGTEVVDLSDL